MRHLSLVSGGISLKLAVITSGIALVAAIGACAEAPVDEYSGGTTSNVNKAEPEQESQKLPESNPPAPKQETKDAGTSSSSSSGATSSSSGSTSSSSSGGSSSGSTSSSGGSSSGGSSSGGTSTSCDPNDSSYVLKAFVELNASSPRTCGTMGGSCKATECCFDVYGVCVDL